LVSIANSLLRYVIVVLILSTYKLLSEIVLRIHYIVFKLDEMDIGIKNSWNGCTIPLAIRLCGLLLSHKSPSARSALLYYNMKHGSHVIILPLLECIDPLNHKSDL